MIRALRAGSFFGEHGHIVTSVEFEAQIDGLVRPVVAGETVATRVGTQVTVSLRMKVPDRDYLGRENRIDTVDLIGISDQGAPVLFSDAPAAARAFSVDVTVPKGGISLRARGRRAVR